MSLFSELKRRNVFRIAIAYLAAAWLVTEVAGTVLPAFGYGDAELRVIIILLAVALIPVLVLSWVFEVTPEGLRREVEVEREASITRYTGKKIDRMIVALLALALGYFAFDKFILDPARDIRIAESAREEGRVEAITETADRSIAVLPFENRSMREEDVYFTDGIHDEILTRLAGIGTLSVTSRTSVMRYRDTTLPIPEIAQELGVATILEGGVQRAGDQVRINVQLIDARSDKHLWAETYTRELNTDSLFAIQSELTARIADALQAHLTPTEQARLFARPTTSLEA